MGIVGKFDYEPTKLEAETIKNLLSPEDEEMSRIREENYRQEINIYEKFKTEIDRHSERRQPSVAERDRMDRDLVALGKLFEGSSLYWHLDGAINVSLQTGDYVGVHKDIDITVELAELQAMDELLHARGYGIFQTSQVDGRERGMRSAKRIGAGTYHPREGHLTIFAIDKNGKIDNSRDLSFIDVHTVRRNEDGEMVGYAGVLLPEEWSQTTEVDFRGYAIRTEHPAEHAYFKLHFGRKYDLEDLKILVKAGKVFSSELDVIQTLVDEERRRYDVAAQETASALAVVLHPEMTVGEIANTLLDQPFISARVDDVHAREYATRLQALLGGGTDLSVSTLKGYIEHVFKVRETHESMAYRLEELKKLANK